MRILKSLGNPWVAAAAAFLVGLAALPVLAHPWFQANWDGVLYLLGARSLAHGHGYTASGVPITIRPPGLSLLLVPFVMGKSVNFRLLNAVMGVVGLGGAVLLFAYARPRLGTAISLAAAVAIWLNPVYQQFSNMTMSDVPGVAFLVGILLVERTARAAPSRSRDLALGLLIGAGCLVRSNTLLVLPAIALSRFVAWSSRHEREPLADFLTGRVAVLAFVVVLSGLPWTFWSRAHLSTHPADQTGNYSYSVAMWHRDRGDPESPRVPLREIVNRWRQRLPSLVWSLHSRLQSARPLPRGAAGPWFGAVLLAAVLVQLVRRREPAEIFIVLSVMVILFYFSFQIRLALPILVFSLLALLELARDAARAVAGRLAGSALPLALLAFLVVLDFQPHAGWRQLERVHRERTRKAETYATCLPPDSRVAMWRMANVYSVLLDRPAYTLSFAYNRGRTTAALEKLIDTYGINTVILEPQMPAAVKQHFSGYPQLEACRDEQVFRVRP